MELNLVLGEAIFREYGSRMEKYVFPNYSFLVQDIRYVLRQYAAPIMLQPSVNVL